MIHPGQSDGWYDELPGIRASWLKALRSQTPAHLLARMHGQGESHDALRFGRAFHAALLQPSVFASWAVAPEVDRRTREGKARWEEFITAVRGLDYITAGESEMLEAMRQSFAASGISRLLEMCEHREVVMTGEIAGQPCKCRIDACSESEAILIDIKTAISAAPRQFGRAAAEYGYPLQMAFYRELMRQNGIDCGAVILVAVEKTRPHCVAAYRIQEADLDRVALEIPELVGRFAECVSTGAWPGYEDRIIDIELPDWA